MPLPTDAMMPNLDMDFSCPDWFLPSGAKKGGSKLKSSMLSMNGTSPDALFNNADHRWGGLALEMTPLEFPTTVQPANLGNVQSANLGGMDDYFYKPEPELTTEPATQVAPAEAGAYAPPMLDLGFNSENVSIGFMGLESTADMNDLSPTDTHEFAGSSSRSSTSDEDAEEEREAPLQRDQRPKRQRRSSTMARPSRKRQDRPAGLVRPSRGSAEEDAVVYTKEQRRAVLMRYRVKVQRFNARKNKKIRYAVRQVFANARLRIRGRFATKEQLAALSKETLNKLRTEQGIPTQ